MPDYDVIVAYEYAIRIVDASSVNDAIGKAMSSDAPPGEKTSGPVLLDARKVTDGT
jgi:hypothetical protein